MASVNERIAYLKHDLATDRVLSSGQLKQYYSLSVNELKDTDLKFVEAFLSPSRGSIRYAQISFVGLSSSIGRLEGNSLRHLAGIAEMRRVLGALPEDWTSLAAARQQPRTPDAFWETERGLLAIEYDVGSYSPTQISEKAKSFKRYAGQVWGAPSRQRVRHLWHLLKPLDSHCVVLYVAWA